MAFRKKKEKKRKILFYGFRTLDTEKAFLEPKLY